ncbi:MULTISPECIES: iron ABC transporter permease [Actinoalloteichus]|uniref:ABC-type Fe3+-siderophore transport system, permease component n=1 Tax=Actinoalloteichus fjordicus TaxID=1612552 RepID=A0AAC9LC72_9PSEU|nr:MULTISPECIES: iron ABC transporter permease [Actinoalloteichus]APU14175.1 ABC-type Fe3+-siderophore transport system, permease component [Actinoalloteichus fjordicus]APU20121.1 ABC-type Fe3+-siderophore transport system, permease component [Actinoalloteichus sp. GBA129-24]
MSTSASGAATLARPPAPPRAPNRRRGRLALLIGGLGAIIVLGSAVHLTQGTSSLDTLDVLRLMFGGGSDDAAAVIVESRLPRLLAAIVVGVALGVAGAVLQSVARNIMASPDTLAVNAGAHLALVAVSAFGLSVPLLGAAGIAFAGGLAAAALVLALSGTGGTGIVRLVLAGTAAALAMAAVTRILLLLFAQETRGLFAWGAGSLGQNGLGGVQTLGPVVGGTLLLLLAMSRRLDLVHLGDDHARSLGVNVGRIRFAAITLAVVLSASAVTLTGPIGFVGLAAPALVRLLVNVVPGLHRHAALIPVSAAMGVVLLLGADVLLRAVIGSQSALEVPTGVVTTVLGGIFLVILARGVRITGRATEPPAAGARGGVQAGRFRLILGALVVGGIGVLAGSVLLGDTNLLLGDVVNWVTGQAGPIVTNVMENRAPRVAAAFLAGASLALAGAVIQAVARNPLAEPGIIGVAGGAGLGAITMITLVPAVGFWAQAGAAGAGAALATTVVFVMAAKGGFASERLVLIGFGVQAVTQALITLLITLTDPWNETKALTWLAGSTYGRSFEHLVPMVLAVLLVVPLLIRARGELDLLSLDDETPRVLGVPVSRSRLLLMVGGVLLTGAAVAGVGVIAFVGLVAPHATRAIVGRRHARALPVAALLGGILVCAADTIGRTVIAPGQLPAGLMTAIIGAPYFIWLLYRSRVRAG